jgi:hypothetical protein
LNRSRPKLRDGLLFAEHSKRGRRFLTALDPTTLQVALLEPFEHAVLTMCDGTRDAAALAELLAPSVDEQPIDLPTIERCLKLFERHRLLELRLVAVTTPPSEEEALQSFYGESLRTGELGPGLPSPFAEAGSPEAPRSSRRAALIETLGRIEEEFARAPVAERERERERGGDFADGETTEENYREGTEGRLMRLFDGGLPDASRSDRRALAEHLRQLEVVLRGDGPGVGALLGRIEARGADAATQEDLSRVLDEALGAGRCPLCLSAVARGARECPACGFEHPASSS